MDLKLLIFIFSVILWSPKDSLGGLLREKRAHEPPSYIRTFLRDSVESRPPSLRFADVKSAYNEHNLYGSKSLPLRSAVESVPEQTSSRLPLRDAVERRPSYDDDFFNLEIKYDAFVPRHVQKTIYSPYVRFQEVFFHNQPIPAPYRISNRHQQLFNVGYRPYNRGRNLKFAEQTRFVQANMNLNEKYQFYPKELIKNNNRHSQPRIVCYLEGIAFYRKEPLAFSSSNIDPFTCTHLIYAFASIDPHGYGLTPRDHEYDIVKGGYRAVTGLKRLNPELKVLISIGDDREEGAHQYSNLVATASRRRIFIKSVIQFLEENGFDGIDLYWQYPGAEELGGRLTDKLNLSLLLEELSEVFQSRNWILSMSVPASRFRIVDGYDVHDLSENVDFVNLKAYDFHTDKEPVADHHAPLIKRDRDAGLNVFFNVDYAVRYWLKRGLARTKLNLGVPFYGRSFTLRFANNTAPGAGIRGPGKPGFYTQTPGLLAYYEICDMSLNEGWTLGEDEIGSPYAYNGLQWTGFETPDSITKKMSYIKDLGLGGVSVWAVDLDDFQGLCGEKFPLLNAVKRSLKNNDLENTIGQIQKDGFNCDRIDGLYSDPNDCSRYIICRAGLQHNLKCHNGAMFDIITGTCGQIRAELCRPGHTVFIPSSVAAMDEMLEAQKLRTERLQTGPKVVCYMTNWAFYRKADGKFVPEHLDTQLCTHVIYAFASLEPEHLMLQEFDPWADLDNNLYQRVTSLADSKVLLAIGGWTDSAGDKYSKLVSDGSARRRFVAGVVSFLRRHGFSGLHIDWNYPVCWQSNCNKGPASDKPNFTKLVQELRTEFNKQTPPLMLAAAISGYKEVIDVAYELKALGESLDFMSAMTYDYHGHWERKTGHVSPLYHRQGDMYMQYNTNYTMEYLVSKGAPREKLLVGVPFYGQSFTLASSSKKEQGVISSGPGDAGELTKQPGMLAYYEICNRIKQHRWTVMRDVQGATGPYAHKGDQWVSYEDVTSVQDKARYITSQGYGGAVAWTVDLDDFSNRCCMETFPLLKALNRGLGLLKDSPPVGGDCTKPPDPVTPPAPTLTTGVDTGASMSTSPMLSTTWPSWSEKPTTTTKRPKPTQSTTEPTTTTTQKSTTTTTAATTTSPWWTTTKTTTLKPMSTSPWWVPTATTTQKETTTTKQTTPIWWQPAETTTIPTPAIVMPERPSNDPQDTECQTGMYTHDPQSCNAYYRCVLGAMRKEYCAGGLHWNKERSMCDWPADAKCKERPQQTTTTHLPLPTLLSTTQRVTTTTKRTQTTTAAAVTADCTPGQYYPHEDCNLFYVCVNGIKVQQKCGPGLQWSVAQNSCDWSFRTKCMRPTPLNKISRIKVQPYSPCEAGAYSAYAGDCGQYLMCLWGKYETFSCADGLHWNHEKHICDWPANAKCSEIQSDEIDEIPSSATNKPVSGISITSKPTPGSYYTSEKPTTTSIRPSTTTETPEALSGYFKIVCYFTNWAWYRRGLGKYTPEHIDPNLCTHIVYGFAVLDYENLIVKAHDSWADFDNKFYERVVAYKAKGVKVSLALGGWNDSAGDKYSRLVNNPAARQRFINHVIGFLEKYDFDGLDLDWEYPKCWQVDCKKGPDSDKAAFAAFVTELKAAFRPKGLLLSAAVSPSKTVIDAGYDVPVMAEHLDWVAVMTYDFHGQWDKKTGHVAPLYLHPDDDVTFFNANYSINYWISEGVPRRKIIMGMPLYGQSFQLEKTDVNGLNAKAPGPGQAGEFTRAAGFLAYYEICDCISNKGWTVVQDPEHRMGPYAYKGNQWVSFDDPEMIRRKSEYIRSMDLGGGMIWALDLDDFRNRCGQGVHPLMNVIRDVLKDPGTGVVQPPQPSTTKPPSTEQPQKATKPSYQPVVVETEMKEPAQITTTTSATIKPLVDSSSDYKVVCYFTNWAWYRQGGGKYVPSDINPDLCTHIIYGFAVLNGDQLIIKPHDSWADLDNKFYEKVTAYRAKGIKILVAIGGWNDSAGDKYSRLVNNPSARRRFIAHVSDFIETNGFDGLDLDWEYPKCWQVDCKKGPASDKPAFAELVRELHEAFAPKGWLLSAAVSPSKRVVDEGYDVPALSKYLDWIAVMCYDYHGQWDKITGHVAPMYAHPEDIDVTFNTNFTIHYWISQGAERKKLVLGMPMYGQSFSLADNNVNGLNSPTYGGGEAGEATRARGFLSYYEICEKIQKKGWQVVRDRKGRMGPYAFLRDQWVSFDDLPMIQHKSEYIKAMGLGGGMIWALDLDDFKNYCGCEEYPLLKTINRVLRGYPAAERDCQLESNTVSGSYGPEKSKPTDKIPVVMTSHCDGRIFSPHENDCNKYYLCNQGQLMVQKCPAGLYWNQDHCDWPRNSKCPAGGTSPVYIESDELPADVTTSSTTTSAMVTEAVTTTSTMKPTLPTVETTMKPLPTVITPIKPIGDTSGYKVVCYYTNWAWYRQGDGKYKPEDIDTDLCTHITYGFAVLDANSLTIKPHDSWADIDNEFYHKVTACRAKGIKVLIAIGGWNDSLGPKYSNLVNNPAARAKFVAHVVQFIEKWGFDGLDLDWEYPKCWQVDCDKGPASDKQGFAALVTELSAQFKPRNWLLSSAVSPSKMVIDAGYDVPTLAQHFDWIAVMTYDFHGHWDKQTGHVAPLYYYPGDTYDYFNANFSLHYWIEKGAPPHKLVMGMPLYGQSFSLADTGKRGLNSKTYGPGEAGEFTRAGGFLAFYEICERVKKRQWTVTRDPEGRIGPYAVSGNQWVSYDDISEIRRKSQLIKQMGLGGGMIWALDLDDFRGRCECGKHPLLKTMNQELRGLDFGISKNDCT